VNSGVLCGVRMFVRKAVELRPSKNVEEKILEIIGSLGLDCEKTVIFVSGEEVRIICIKPL